VVLVRGYLEVLRNHEGGSEEELKPIESAEKGEEGGGCKILRLFELREKAEIS
jgi:hypothetical protein